MPNHQGTQRIKTQQLILQPATKEDATIIQDMQKEAFAALLEKYQDHNTNPANESLERITQKITQPDSYYYYIMVE